LERHANLKNLEMLFTSMLFKIKGLEIDHVVKPNQPTQISNELEIDFTLTQPNYALNIGFTDK